jgi:hypothetical protein
MRPLMSQQKSGAGRDCPQTDHQIMIEESRWDEVISTIELGGRFYSLPLPA